VADQVPIRRRPRQRPVGHPPKRRPANRQPRAIRLTHRSPTSRSNHQRRELPGPLQPLLAATSAPTRPPAMTAPRTRFGGAAARLQPSPGGTVCP
jgi:hypothetical protein